MAITNYYSTLEIIRPSNVKTSPLGGQIIQWVRVPFQGVIYRSNSQMSQTGGKSGETTEAILICEMCEIEKGDRIIDLDGTVYQVKGNPNNSMKKNHHLECDLIITTGVDI